MPDPISSYIANVQRNLQSGIATEHTYRSALEALVEALATGATAFNDPKRVQCGAPDFTVARSTKHGPLTVGYIEAKDIDTDLQAIERDAARKSPTTRDGEQLKRYLTLPNLILTDYLEFRWYVDGERRMPPARLARPIQAGKLQREPAGPEAVAQLIRAFLDHKPPPVSKPRDLALRMARLTHLIRDVIIAAFDKNKASGTLRDLHQSFQDTLIPDLEVPEFADMYAQTLAYGLFAARVNHSGPHPFRRLGAAAEIPKSNPFLRRLFGTITGPDLDDEPYVGLVDDLAQLLDQTEMEAVLADFGKRGIRQDPVLHFYQTFLAAYDPQIREMRGVYYTPEPVVSYIVRSVDHLLKNRFGCPQGLADASTVTYTRPAQDGDERKGASHRVLILDPACGTGTFLYTVIDLIREEFMRQGNAGMWPGYVREHLLPRLFGFELMMAPYAMAHLKLAMQLSAQDLPEKQRPAWAYDFVGDERLGIYLTNSLEEALKHSELLMGSYISDEANAAAEIKRDLPIMVVLGNPPYSGHSANRSEMTVEVLETRRIEDKKAKTFKAKTFIRKKKVKTFIGQLIQDYYQVDGQPLGERNPKWLQDDYVKFIRFGQWRIQQTGAGILAFITNHSYLDNPTFRGMRQQLMHSFTDIYVLDLHGSTKKKEACPDGSPDENVFDIQQGVAIGIFVNEPGRSEPATVHHADLWGLRQPKNNTLFEIDVDSTQWAELTPESPFYLFVPQRTELRPEYERGWKLTDAMPLNSVGIVTSRDGFVLDLDDGALRARIADFLSPKNSDDTVRQRYFGTEPRGDYLPGDNRDWKMAEKRKLLQKDPAWSSAFKSCLYRPFDPRPLFYHAAAIDFPRPEVMRHMLAGANVGFHLCRQIVSQTWRHVLATNRVTDDCYVSNKTRERGYTLALYLYPQEGAQAVQQTERQRRPNLNPAFVADIEKRLRLSFVSDGAGDLQNTFGPEDVFHYIYAVLHSPTYRSRYAAFLKIDFPRIPLTSDLGLLRPLCAKGKELVALHLMQSSLLSSLITTYPVAGDNTIEKGHPRYLARGEQDPATGKPLTSGRVYISRDVPKTGKKGQYFDGVPQDVWDFHVGGYQVCEKWLKDRRGRTLSYGDLAHYQKIIVALKETIRLMAEIDQTIPSWPLE